ncbi:hypothetical protein RFI_25404 [Reticulomyxa filosa]|uniref:WD-40 repeat protein n=1 Tax=Reticulomyxa filosa TaxID=46433 RepID=X6MD82_RETFI|nr:hypothetical protein RFI_25404 [Reticulomyxa filosa]|eukprot:ETO11973.1 hypothetical protein RFI_25404 [Reticulomyxa filosa]
MLTNNTNNKNLIEKENIIMSPSRYSKNEEMTILNFFILICFLHHPNCSRHSVDTLIECLILTGGDQFICSESSDKQSVENNTNSIIQLTFKSYNCMKFSSYHYHNYNTICFYHDCFDFRNKPLQIFNGQLNVAIDCNGYAICLDHLIKPFEYGILKQRNNWIYSKDIQLITNFVWAVEYSPFVVKNINEVFGRNVICSGSEDSTICFWDIRTNKQLRVIRGDSGIYSLQFLPLNNEKLIAVVVVLICVMYHFQQKYMSQHVHSFITPDLTKIFQDLRYFQIKNFNSCNKIIEHCNEQIFL